jgi:hypothetical protein
MKENLKGRLVITVCYYSVLVSYDESFKLVPYLIILVRNCSIVAAHCLGG